MRLHQQIAALTQQIAALTLTLLAAAAFASPAFAAVTGTVITLDGQPVSGAKVSLFAPEASDARQQRLFSKTPERVALVAGTTDAKGNFSLDAGTNPVVDVRLEARGFAPDATRADATDDLGALALEPADLKKGTVTAAGKPVAGAVVTWSGPGVELVTTTAADGSYSVPDPGVWASRVVVLHPDFAPSDETAIRSGSKLSVARTLTAGTKLTGMVVAADGKTPVKASLRLDEWRVGETADDGTFSVAHAPAKWAKLMAFTADRVGIRTHGGDAALTIKLGPAATLSGSVRDAKGQKPLPGSEVRLGAERVFVLATNVGRTALTDAKGNFTITGIEPGHYTLSLSRPGYSAGAMPLTLEPGQKGSKGVLAVQRGRVTGTVTDEEHHGVGGARVTAASAARDGGFGPRGGLGGLAGMFQQQAQRYSAPDGHYVIRIEPDADLKVEAQKKGYPSATSSALRVTAGETKSGVNLTIPKGVALTGKVLDGNGKAVSGASVTAMPGESGGGPGGPGGPGGARMIRRAINIGGGGRSRGDEAVTSGSDGTFSMRLKEGSYDLTVSREGFAAKNLTAVRVTANAKPVEITLEPGVSLNGRVTRGGKPVEGANVILLSEGGSPNTVTAADGSFRFDDLTPGQAMLNVNKQDEFLQAIRPISVPAKDFNIDLPGGGRITGHVIDKSGSKPVTTFDAGIQASRGGGGMMIMTPPQLKSFTSDDGSFVLENVPPGPTTVIVQAAGYANGRVPGLTVEDGKAVADIEVSLDPAVRLVGRVTGPDGAGVAGVNVRLEANEGGGGGRMMRMGGGESNASTDANGDYTLEGLESGEHSFTFQKSGFPAESRSATLSSKETRLDVRLSAGATVTGRVVTDSGAPVPDASIRAMSAADGAFGRTTTADAGGTFHFEGLAPGHYNFSGAKSGFADGQLRDVDIAATGPITITLKTGGVLYGTVRGLPPADLQSVSVSAQSSSGNASASVDSAGAYRIDGAPIGTVRLTAQKGGGFTDSARTPAKTVQVEAGTPQQVDLEFDVSVVLTGHVTRNGAPVANAPLVFNPDGRGGAQVRTTTGNDGTYSAAGLQEGTYNVSVVDLTGMGAYSTTYEVKGSARFDIDMKTVSLRGRVSDSDTGEAVANATIEMRPDDSSGGGGMRSTRMAVTDPGGNFVFDSIVAGAYQVTAGKDSYGSKVTPLQVGNNSPGDMDIKLRKEGGVTLRVVDGRDGRLLNAGVRVYDSSNTVVSDGFPVLDSAAGEMHLGLTAGFYRAVVSAVGYATQTVTFSAPSSQSVRLTPGGTLLLRSKASTVTYGKLILNGVEYNRGAGRNATFSIDPRPGVTTLQNIAAGTFVLQLLDAAGRPTGSVPVQIVDGQETTLDI